MSDEPEIAISRFRQVIYTDYTGVLINDTPHQRTRDKSPHRRSPKLRSRPGEIRRRFPELTLDFDVAPLMTGDRDLGPDLDPRDFDATGSSTDARGIGNWAHTPVTGHWLVIIPLRV